MFPCRNQYGKTPIEAAVDCGNIEIIQNMIEGRGDISIDDVVSEIAERKLHYFVHQGKINQLKALLSLGSIQDVPADDGSTAFTLALGTLNTGMHGSLMSSHA